MSAFIDAISGGRGRVIPGLSVAFPGGTMRFASASMSSISTSHYTGKVLNWGQINYQRSERGGQLSAVETRVQVDDADRSIARVYAGASSGSVRGSAATIYLMSPDVASSSWMTIFTGVVTKVSFPSPFVAEITLRTNDDQLQRKSPRGGWALTRQNWPNADPENYGKMAPIIYGVHDSSKFQTTPGLIPTLLIDKITFRYLVCAGKAKSITRVFVDGVATPTGWTTEYVTRNGRIYTCLNFTTDQGEADVTCDLVGYEHIGDGSGNVIASPNYGPATQWAHWISNFVLGDYMTGAWAAHNSIIDSTALSALETRLMGIGADGAHYVADPLTGIEITARFCNTFKLRAWWTYAGKIAIAKDDPHVSDVYGGERWRWYRDEAGPFAFRDNDFERKTRTVARAAYSASQGSYLQTLEVVADAGATTELQDFQDMPWSAAS